MSDRIVTGIYAQVSSENQIFNYLLTDGAYHDPALASQIVGGTARIAIASDATFDITEEISFQPQGGSSGTSIGQIPIINDDGFFDSWARRTVAGMDWTVKRGYADQPWSEWVTLFAGKGRGRPEFSGQRIIVTLTDRFGYMREPVAQAVFDDSTANQSLRNTTAPMVFGEAYQVRPALADPNILAYFSADNLAQVYSTSEGGNPATPQWVPLPQGAQLLSSPSLLITTDIAGPPAPIADEEDDVLNGEGQFEDWDSNGELQYPGLIVTTTDDATLTEGADSDSGVLSIDAATLVDTGWVVGTAISYSDDQPQQGRQWWTDDTSSPAVISDINSVGGSHAEVPLGGRGGGQWQRSNQMVVSSLGLSIPEGASISGIELNCRMRVNVASPGTTFFFRVGVRLPSGVTLYGDKNGTATGATTSFTDIILGAEDYLWGANTDILTPEIVNDPAFRYVIAVNATGAASNPLRVELDYFACRVFYTQEQRYVRFLWPDVMEAGERYTVIIDSLDGSGSLIADWSDSVQADDPQSGRTALVDGEGQIASVFTASQSDFDLYFLRGENGDQEISSITLRKGSSALNRYHELIRYLHETAGRDPEAVCDNDALALVQLQADNPRLGWYVSDQTTREQLSTFLSHSLSAVTWGGSDGKWKAAQLRIPSRPDGDYLRVVNSFSEPSAVPDYADDLRDRVHSAKNFYPIPESEAAGVTAGWTREQREQITADWRITERADPDNIVEYSSPIELTVTDIQPKWGLDTGGTEVTISGTGFVFGAEVVIGGAQATSVDVQSSEKIVAVTPAGTAGPAPVVVNAGGETYAMVGEFEYTDEPLDTPGQGAIFRASFEDASGRDPLATALLDRLSARKLAGHNVLCYEYPPMMAEKVIPVALEDYDKTIPGKMIWVQDEYDPLFKMGRWAQIQSRTFGSNPTDVRLGVRISDHPESFKEFPGDIPILTEDGQPIITEDGQQILFG